MSESIRLNDGLDTYRYYNVGTAGISSDDKNIKEEEAKEELLAEPKKILNLVEMQEILVQAIIVKYKCTANYAIQLLNLTYNYMNIVDIGVDSKDADVNANMYNYNQYIDALLKQTINKSTSKLNDVYTTDSTGTNNVDTTLHTKM